MSGLQREKFRAEKIAMTILYGIDNEELKESIRDFVQRQGDHIHYIYLHKL